MTSTKIPLKSASKTGLSILEGLTESCAANENQTSSKDQISLEFDQVTFAYQDGEEILQNVSFTVEKGGLYFLTGASGIGKSSLLQLIYKGQDRYLGRINIFGKDLQSISDAELAAFRQKIGIVFQEFNLFDHLSTVDNVALALTLKGEELSAARDQASELLSWLGLGSLLHKMPSTLSGGQRQRIALARAVITDPDIILADEPTGHVDDETAHKIMSLFENLNRRGKTVIISTHNRTLIEKTKSQELEIKDKTVTLVKARTTAATKKVKKTTRAKKTVKKAAPKAKSTSKKEVKNA